MVWERLLNANNNSLGSYWANYFNNQNNTFAASSSMVYEGSGVTDPNIVVDDFDNITVIGEKFVANGGTTTYSVMTNRMSANGAWGTAAEHATPVERPNGRGNVAYGVTDSNGNVIMVYHQINGTQYELLIDEYNNLSNTWIGAEPMVSTSNQIEAFRVYRSANQQPLLTWSERYTDLDGNRRYKALSKKRLSQSQWDTERVIVDQLTNYAEPIQLHIDDQNNEKLIWSENPLLNGTIWSANYSSDTDQWQQARNLIPGDPNSYLQYTLHPIGPGEIQLIANKNGTSMTLYSIDYR